MIKIHLVFFFSGYCAFELRRNAAASNRPFQLNPVESNANVARVGVSLVLKPLVHVCSFCLSTENISVYDLPFDVGK